MSSSDVIALLSLIVSILTLGLGYLAYRRFLVQQLTQKQLDIVLGLVTEINRDKNEYVTISGAVFPFQRVSILDIPTIETFSSHDRLYFIKTGIIQDRTDYILNWGFAAKYYKDPLLPLGIAQKLSVFVFKDKSSIKPIPIQEILQFSFDDPKILIGNRRFDEISTVVCYKDTPLEYSDTFQKCTTELKKEIIKWLKKHGIKNINLFADDEQYLMPDR